PEAEEHGTAHHDRNGYCVQPAPRDENQQAQEVQHSQGGTGQSRRPELEEKSCRQQQQTERQEADFIEEDEEVAAAVDVRGHDQRNASQQAAEQQAQADQVAL